MSEGRYPADVAAHFLGDELRPAYLGFLDFASGPVRLWGPGVHPIEWDGHTWYGCGALVHIAPLAESSEGRAIALEVELSPIPLTLVHDGVEIDILNIALNEDWHGRAAILWTGLFETDSLRWKSEPSQIGKGFMDVMELVEAKTAAIRMTIEGGAFDNQRTDVWRYTPAAQRALFPGDAFCDQVPLLQDRPITWNLG